jgi:hypothetical protein
MVTETAHRCISYYCNGGVRNVKESVYYVIYNASLEELNNMKGLIHPYTI